MKQSNQLIFRTERTSKYSCYSFEKSQLNTKKDPEIKRFWNKQTRKELGTPWKLFVSPLSRLFQTILLKQMGEIHQQTKFAPSRLRQAGQYIHNVITEWLITSKYGITILADCPIADYKQNNKKYTRQAKNKNIRQKGTSLHQFNPDKVSSYCSGKAVHSEAPVDLYYHFANPWTLSLGWCRYHVYRMI